MTTRTVRLNDEDTHTTEDRRVLTWIVRVGSASAPTKRPVLIPIEDRELVIGRIMDPPVDDPWMSAQHAEICRESEGWVLRDLGSSNGTCYWGKRQSSALLADGDLFETGGTFWRFRSQVIEGALPEGPYDQTLSTLNAAFKQTVNRVKRVARTRVPVMLLGSTGSGKEVFAKQVHAQSQREGKFVAINTAAIQKNLVASELFGVEKGAHSTADRARTGQVRIAEGGTLLLDEIGDMPFEVQAALLRMLQESEIVPVGGDSPTKVDVRIVCATHQDLEAMVDAGTFRADLYARLKGCRVYIPDLKDRPEDIGLLIARFLEKYGGEELIFRPAAYRALMLYPWPLNVRELEKAIETAIALVETDKIEKRHLPEAVQKHKIEAPATERDTGAALEAGYDRELRRLLEVHRGNVSAVARSMGKSRMQIHRWLKRLELDPETFRG